MMGVLDRFLRSVDSWLLNLDARFDENGNPSDICDVARGGAYNLHLQYDARDRLIAAGSGAFGGDGWHRYTYDALDNIKSWKLGAGGKDYANYYYDPGTNRLQGIRDSAGATVVGLACDAQGNLQNKSGQLYGFGFDNRLYIASGKEQYRYDGGGRRVLAWSPVDGTSALSQYSKSGQLMYYSKSSGAGLEHIYLSGSLIAKRETVGNVVKFQHTDALGSPVAVTDGSGNVIERNDYAPYGAVIGKPAYDAVGYIGHKQDGATGLTYMQQRYYDPQIGRFLSVDPVTAYSNPVGAFNRYRYANNNPYRFTDPDGRYSCTRHGGQCKVADAKLAESFVAAAGGAHEKMREGSAKKLLGGILKTIGSPNDGNGFVIDFSSLPKDTLGQMSSSGMILDSRQINNSARELGVSA